MAGFVLAIVCCTALLLSAAMCLAYLAMFARAWRSYRQGSNSTAAAGVQREVLTSQPTLLKGLWITMLVIG